MMTAEREETSREPGASGDTPAVASGPGRPSSVTLWHLALGLFVLACVAGALVVAEPLDAGYAGLTLLIGITVTGAAMLFLLATGQIAPGALPPRLFQAMADSDPKPMCLTGPDGAALYANKAWKKFFGQTPTGGIILPVVAFSGDEESAQRIYQLVRAASLGEPRSEEVKLRGPIARHVRLATTPVSRGEYAIWRVVDLAPRRALQAVDAPRQNVVVAFRPIEAKSKDAAPPPKSSVSGTDLAQRFEDFFGAAPVGVAVLDARGAIIEANAAFKTFTGAEGEVQGRLFYDFLKEMSGQEVRQRLGAAIQGDAAPGPADVRFRGAQERTAHLYASAVSSSESSGAAVVIYLIDTTEQTELETQFAQSQKMQAVGQLAGGIAHDFNNLLTVINGFSEMLLHRHPPGDPSFQDIHQIRSTGLRAAGLVRQLLAFSRQQTLEPQIVSITDIVSDWSITLRRLIGERVTLKVEHGRDLWPVKADPNQIGNVLINLSVNARDAMPQGGTLTIRTSKTTIADGQPPAHLPMAAGDYVVIEVIDTGVGIPPENLAKIFEPFFTTKEKGHGTGLGLSSVYGIVEQTGGYIYPDSEVGKGTSFNIYLPRFEAPADTASGAVSAEVPQPAEDAPSRPRDLTGHQTVLLVEDEAAVRDFAARALTMRGYQVIEASSGDEALELLREHQGHIDLLVSDVVMPGMDGPTLVKTIRIERPDMKIMFMSGYAEEAFRNAGERIEDFHFLPKPFSLKQLTAKVKDVLEA
jgi:two-component system, cell cycle sensor histidine kinase and response regulator CckA